MFDIPPDERIVSANHLRRWHEKAVRLMSCAALLAAIAIPPQVGAQPVAPTVMVRTAERAPLLLEPDERREPLRMLEPGTLLRVIKQTGEWVQVVYADPQWRDRIGYVHVRYLLSQSAPAAPAASPAATTAASAPAAAMPNKETAAPVAPSTPNPQPSAAPQVAAAASPAAPTSVAPPSIAPAPSVAQPQSVPPKDPVAPAAEAASSVKSAETPAVRAEQPRPAANPSSTLELIDWVGQRFVVLPLSPTSRDSGILEFVPPISAKDWAGQVLTATKVDAGGRSIAALNSGTVYVEFTTESGQTLRATAVNGSVRGIAPLRDFEYARSTWLNQSLWLIEPSVATYDPGSPAGTPVKSRNLGRTAHVVVRDVMHGWQTNAPVRLLVQADDGRTGFVDVRMTETNVSRIQRGGNASFAKTFYTTDPRVAHKDWPARVWSAISDSEVFVGMTATQARMSWGEPSRVNETVVSGLRSQQWIYGDGTYLSIVDDVVSEVQQ